MESADAGSADTPIASAAMIAGRNLDFVTAVMATLLRLDIEVCKIF
jgi:hypothetical protein